MEGYIYKNQANELIRKRKMIKKNPYYPWVEEGLIVYDCIRTYDGIIKTIKEIEDVHVNSVRFTNNTTSPMSILQPITEWIPIDKYKPNSRENLFLNEQEHWMIGYYNSKTNSCESEHEAMNYITHWVPKPILPKDDSKE